MKKHNSDIEINRIKGSLIGGAIGDALGYVVEFTSYENIVNTYGEKGIIDMPNPALISDDTQMTLFTAEGIIRAVDSHIVTSVYNSYLRWLYTQGETIKDESILSGKLIKNEELLVQRSPGNSCLSSLSSGEIGKIKKPINNSKGCGGVMRSAPFGLCSVDSPFELACECAAITHGHPTGYLAAGAFAQIISDICHGKSLIFSINDTIDTLKKHDNSIETINAIEKAVKLSLETPSVEHLKLLGEGWIAEEALGIALYSALCYPDDFEKAIILAVNHGGDSDSTGSICGNILGAILGLEAIPAKWLDAIQLKDLIFETANDLYIK